MRTYATSQTLKCIECGDEFFRARRRGSMTTCRKCQNRVRVNKWRKDNPERSKLHSQGNIEKKRLHDRERSKTTRGREQSRIRQRRYHEKHGRERKRIRYATDPEFRLRSVLRARLNVAIKNGARGGSAVRDLGCSIGELMDHLASQFAPGMSWSNWGRHGWHIDHKRPLSSFDLTDPEQIRTACHFSNLQPLWASDNISKGGAVA